MASQPRPSSVSDNEGLRVLAFVLTVAAGVYAHHDFIKRTGLVDSYWFDHWLVNYSFGFVRRGLLGTFLGLFGHPQRSVLFVSFLAAAITASILFLFVRELLRVVPTKSMGTLVYLAAFLLSPLTCVFVECVGDTLQISILLAMLVIMVVTKWKLSLFVEFVVFAITMVISILIHEGSLFISGPLFPLVLLARRSGRPLLKDVWPHAVVAAGYGAILFSLAFVLVVRGTVDESKRVAFMSSLYSYNELSRKVYIPTIPLMFQSVAEQQKESDFRTKSSYGIVKKLMTVSAVPVLLCYLFLQLPALQRRSIRLVFCKYLACFFLLSLPLYIVAHDWGRFTMYTLLLCLFCFSRMNGYGGESTIAPMRIEEERSFSEFISRKTFLPVLLFFSLYSIHVAYRFDGLRDRSFVVFLLVGSAILFLERSSKKKIQFALVK